MAGLKKQTKYPAKWQLPGCKQVSVEYLPIFTLYFPPQLSSTGNLQTQVRTETFLAKQEEISGQ